MADPDERDENVDSMETDSASEGKSESPPKRPDNLCCYSQKECDLEKLKGFDFCHKHILEDSASPFKPCDFISKTNGKKCTNPAPKLPGGQRTYCLIHTRDSELRKALEAKTKKKKRKLSGQQEDQTKPLTPKLGPGRPPGVRNYTKRPKAIDLATEYRRDDVLRVESSWHGDYESDSESLDNDMDDPLRHAGVWSAEEVTKICRDKLLRLRSLYMSQFERLKHVYKNKRRKFLLATSANDEGLTACAKGPEPNEPLSSLHIASRCYNKRYRTDALLQKQSKEKRLGPAARNQTLPHQRCTHYTEGNRCTSKIVPLAKFCLKHICHDPNQQLFLPCSQIISADQSCGVAVPNISNHEKCILHLPHSNDLSIGDLEQELREAKERQLIKEKETEDRRKAALAQAAHEARLSEIAVAKAITAQQTQIPKEDIKTPTELQAKQNTQQGSSTAPNTQQNEKPTTTKLPPKFSESPTTNNQIKTQAEKLIVSNVASPALLPTASASKQRESKVSYPANSSNTNVKDTPPETASQPFNVNTLSTSANTQVKPTDTLASPLSVKPCTSTNSNATTADLEQANSLDNTLEGTEERNSVLPAIKPVVSADTSVQGSPLKVSAPANPEVTKNNKKSSSSEMDVGI